MTVNRGTLPVSLRRILAGIAQERSFFTLLLEIPNITLREPDFHVP